MNNYEIVRLGQMWPTASLFAGESAPIINDTIASMSGIYEAYNFENHIFDLQDFLKMFFAYFRKNIMNIDNKNEKTLWLDQFVLKVIDTLPSLYVTSKLLTEKFLEKITPEMGSKTLLESKSGLNTSNFDFDMDNNKFGSIGKNETINTNNDITSILTNIINWAYPSFIGNWLQSFRQFLFITTYAGSE